MHLPRVYAQSANHVAGLNTSLPHCHQQRSTHLADFDCLLTKARADHAKPTKPTNAQRRAVTRPQVSTFHQPSVLIRTADALMMKRRIKKSDDSC
jgi:hypothetical protein